MELVDGKVLDRIAGAHSGHAHIHTLAKRSHFAGGRDPQEEIFYSCTNQKETPCMRSAGYPRFTAWKLASQDPPVFDAARSPVHGQTLAVNLVNPDLSCFTLVTQRRNTDDDETFGIPPDR